MMPIRQALKRFIDFYNIPLPGELELFRQVNPSLLLYSQLPQHSRELIAPFLPYSKA